MAIKKCPHCGGTTFLAKVTRAAKVSSAEDGTFTIDQETQKYDLEIVKCNACKADVTVEDLVELVPCKNCGTLTIPSNLDENGVCDVCKAIEVRPDLAGASKEDLIRMLLKLEHTPKAIQKTEEKASQLDQVDQTPAPVETSKEATTPTQETSVSDSEETTPTGSVADRMAAAQAAIDSVSTESTDTPEKAPVEKTTTKRKRAVRKTTTTKESTDDSTSDETEAEVKEETAPESSADFMNQPTDPQQAPFPQQEQALQDIFSQQPSNEAQASAPKLPDGGFPLFDNNEEQSF